MHKRPVIKEVVERANFLRKIGTVNNSRYKYCIATMALARVNTLHQIFSNRKRVHRSKTVCPSMKNRDVRMVRLKGTNTVVVYICRRRS